MGTNELIAVVGISARCAGANNVDEYWELLESRVPQFRPVPEARWADRSTERVPGRGNRTYSHVIAPLDDPFALDAKGFGIAPSRARRMDPQQRLAIGLTGELLARAGTSGAELERKGRVATVLGVSSTDYRSVSAAGLVAGLLVDGTFGAGTPQDRETVGRASKAIREMDGHTMPGVLANMVPAAVQSAFDFTGPAFSVDSACASSLSAVEVACDALILRRVRSCIVGGVFTALTPEAHVGFSAIGALSPTGQCRPFTSLADGFVLGEGGALLLLKRLSDALADGDAVLAVIGGAGSSNDGRADSVMTPTVRGQVAAVSQAIQNNPGRNAQVDAIKGHGTATKTGDQTELSTLKSVYGGQERRTPILLGSVKALVGHTMAASGALALVKAVLALQHNAWPGQPDADVAIPSAELFEMPFDLERRSDPSKPLNRVGVNAFGFGGTNVHVIVETAP